MHLHLCPWIRCTVALTILMSASLASAQNGTVQKVDLAGVVSDDIEFTAIHRKAATSHFAVAGFFRDGGVVPFVCLDELKVLSNKLTTIRLDKLKEYSPRGVFVTIGGMVSGNTEVWLCGEQGDGGSLMVGQKRGFVSRIVVKDCQELVSMNTGFFIAGFPLPGDPKQPSNKPINNDGRIVLTDLNFIGSDVDVCGYYYQAANIEDAKTVPVPIARRFTQSELISLLDEKEHAVTTGIVTNFVPYGVQLHGFHQDAKESKKNSTSVFGIAFGPQSGYSKDRDKEFQELKLGIPLINNGGAVSFFSAGTFPGDNKMIENGTVLVGHRGSRVW